MSWLLIVAVVFCSTRMYAPGPDDKAAGESFIAEVAQMGASAASPSPVAAAGGSLAPAAATERRSTPPESPDAPQAPGAKPARTVQEKSPSASTQGPDPDASVVTPNPLSKLKPAASTSSVFGVSRNGTAPKQLWATQWTDTSDAVISGALPSTDSTAPKGSRVYLPSTRFFSSVTAPLKSRSSTPSSSDDTPSPARELTDSDEEQLLAGLKYKIALFKQAIQELEDELGPRHAKSKNPELVALNNRLAHMQGVHDQIKFAADKSLIRKDGGKEKAESSYALALAEANKLTTSESSYTDEDLEAAAEKRAKKALYDAELHKDPKTQRADPAKQRALKVFLKFMAEANFEKQLKLLRDALGMNKQGDTIENLFSRFHGLLNQGSEDSTTQIESEVKVVGAITPQELNDALDGEEFQKLLVKVRAVRTRDNQLVKALAQEQRFFERDNERYQEAREKAGKARTRPKPKSEEKRKATEASKMAEEEVVEKAELEEAIRNRRKAALERAASVTAQVAGMSIEDRVKARQEELSNMSDDLKATRDDSKTEAAQKALTKRLEVDKDRAATALTALRGGAETSDPASPTFVGAPLANLLTNRFLVVKGDGTIEIHEDAESARMAAGKALPPAGGAGESDEAAAERANKRIIPLHDIDLAAAAEFTEGSSEGVALRGFRQQMLTAAGLFMKDLSPEHQQAVRNFILHTPELMQDLAQAHADAVKQAKDAAVDARFAHEALQEARAKAQRTSKTGAVKEFAEELERTKQLSRSHAKEHKPALGRTSSVSEISSPARWKELSKEHRQALSALHARIVAEMEAVKTRLLTAEDEHAADQAAAELLALEDLTYQTSQKQRKPEDGRTYPETLVADKLSEFKRAKQAEEAARAAEESAYKMYRRVVRNADGTPKLKAVREEERLLSGSGSPTYDPSHPGDTSPLVRRERTGTKEIFEVETEELQLADGTTFDSAQRNFDAEVKKAKERLENMLKQMRGDIAIPDTIKGLVMELKALRAQLEREDRLGSEATEVARKIADLENKIRMAATPKRTSASGEPETPQKTEAYSGQNHAVADEWLTRFNTLQEAEKAELAQFEAHEKQLKANHDAKIAELKKLVNADIAWQAGAEYARLQKALKSQQNEVVRAQLEAEIAKQEELMRKPSPLPQKRTPGSRSAAVLTRKDPISSSTSTTPQEVDGAKPNAAAASATASPAAQQNPVGVPTESTSPTPGKPQPQSQPQPPVPPPAAPKPSQTPKEKDRNQKERIAIYEGVIDEEDSLAALREELAGYQKFNRNQIFATALELADESGISGRDLVPDWWARLKRTPKYAELANYNPSDTTKKIPPIRLIALRLERKALKLAIGFVENDEIATAKRSKILEVYRACKTLEELAAVHQKVMLVLSPNSTAKDQQRQKLLTDGELPDDKDLPKPNGRVGRLREKLRVNTREKLYKKYQRNMAGGSWLRRQASRLALWRKKQLPTRLTADDVLREKLMREARIRARAAMRAAGVDRSTDDYSSYKKALASRYTDAKGRGLSGDALIAAHAKVMRRLKEKAVGKQLTKKQETLLNKKKSKVYMDSNPMLGERKVTTNPLFVQRK